LTQTAFAATFSKLTGDRESHRPPGQKEDFEQAMRRACFLIAGGLLAVAASVSAQPQIVYQPQSKTAVLGSTVLFSVEATAATPLQYQWQFNGQDLPRARSRVLRLLATPTRAGTYSVRVRDAAGERVSSAARLEVVKRPAFIVQPQNAVVGEHTVAEFRTQLNESGPYSRMIWHNDNPIEGPHEIPPSTGYITDEPVLTMENPINDPTWNSVYWLAVTNAGAGIVSRKARLTVIGPPVLIVQPQDRTIKAGATLTLPVKVAANAGPPETFQWYREGKIIDGATRKNLILKNIQPADQGNYYCLVTGIGGRTTSWGAQVTVLSAPVY
jgi:hypothetical protein